MARPAGSPLSWCLPLEKEPSSRNSLRLGGGELRGCSETLYPKARGKSKSYVMGVVKFIQMLSGRLQSGFVVVASQVVPHSLSGSRQ